jgi:hypothetical protein
MITPQTSFAARKSFLLLNISGLCGMSAIPAD